MLNQTLNRRRDGAREVGKSRRSRIQVGHFPQQSTERRISLRAIATLLRQCMRGGCFLRGSARACATRHLNRGECLSNESVALELSPMCDNALGGVCCTCCNPSVVHYYANVSGCPSLLSSLFLARARACALLSRIPRQIRDRLIYLRSD